MSYLYKLINFSKLVWVHNIWDAISSRVEISIFHFTFLLFKAFPAFVPQSLVWPLAEFVTLTPKFSFRFKRGTFFLVIDDFVKFLFIYSLESISSRTRSHSDIVNNDAQAKTDAKPKPIMPPPSNYKFYPTSWYIS